MTALCYALTVLIWGTTWIAIKSQLGVVPAEASIAYRFALAGAVLLLWLLVTRKFRPIPLRHQPFVLLQALCLFCCNFLCIYFASHYVASGIVSVVFSAATIFNIVNAFLVHGRRPARRILAGAIVGVAGIACLFRETMTGAAFSHDTAVGLGLALLGTWFFSMGNLLSARNQKQGLPLASVNASAMLYGAAVVGLFAVVRGVPFRFDPSPVYVGSLLYLAIPGSVIAFTTYLLVVHRLGPERASYMTVLFPVIALTMSMIFEHYHVTPSGFVGLVLVLIGNVLVLVKGRALTSNVLQPS